MRADSAAPLGVPRVAPALVASDDGHVFACGGYRGGGALDTVERYDADADRWSPMPPLPGPRMGATATSARGGAVVVCGGMIPDPAALSTLDVYDPGRDAWTR